jgi:nucleotide-binding universal stress UspA family protein
MSTHGRSGLNRWLNGSVTDSVLRQTSIPVLVVPPHAHRPLPTEQPIRLLVPLDGSPLAEEAIHAAERLAVDSEVEIVLLRVVEPPPYTLYGDGYAYVPYDPDAELAEVRRYLQVRVDRLQAAGRRATARAVVGQPSLMVARVAHDEEADIVMMATHGRGGLARLVLGSVSTATLQRAETPVLLVRPSAMRQARQAPHMGLEARDESPIAARPTAAPLNPTVSVSLSMADLELIEHGLRSLGSTVGYAYHQAPRAHRLLDRLDGAARRLEHAAYVDAPEPARTR